MLTFGSIGCGNMGGAILEGVAKLGTSGIWRVIGFDPNQAAVKGLRERCGLTPCADEIETARQADVVLIAVKPEHVRAVLEKIAPHLTGKLLISLAAGVALERIKTYSADACPSPAFRRWRAATTLSSASCPTRPPWWAKAAARSALTTRR